MALCIISHYQRYCQHLQHCCYGVLCLRRYVTASNSVATASNSVATASNSVATASNSVAKGCYDSVTRCVTVLQMQITCIYSI